MGLIYWASAIVLGAVFVWYALRLLHDSTGPRATATAMGLFTYSISYVTLLFSAIAVDQLVHHV
jgi:protoheme IX farnesyltransferase